MLTKVLMLIYLIVKCYREIIFRQHRSIDNTSVVYWHMLV